MFLNLLAQRASQQEYLKPPCVLKGTVTSNLNMSMPATESITDASTAHASPVRSIARDRPRRNVTPPSRLVMNMDDTIEYYDTELVTSTLDDGALDDLIGEETDTMYATTDTEADERPSVADVKFIDGDCNDMYTVDTEFIPEEESSSDDYSSSDEQDSYMSDEEDDEGDCTDDDSETVSD